MKTVARTVLAAFTAGLAAESARPARAQDSHPLSLEAARPTPETSRNLTLADVRFQAYGPAGAAARAAHPRRGWRPKTDPNATLRLDLRPGEAMDMAWARRQFSINGLIGAPTTADRVVSLVLLINEAFSQNGYISTGLRFAAHEWPTQAGVLDLWLVKGVVTPQRRRGGGIAVTWADKRRSGAARNPTARVYGAIQDLGGEKGAGGLTRGYVRDRMPSAGEVPLNTVDLERDFRLLTDDPAIRTITAQLIPGDAPGEARLSLAVEPKPRVDVYAMAATSRSPSIGGIRYSGGAIVRNVAFSGDVLSIDGGETDGLADGSVRYSTPFLGPSTTLDVHGAIDQAAVLAQAVRDLGVGSKEAGFDAGLTQRLIAIPLTPKPGGAGWLDAQSLNVGFRIVTDHAYSSLLGQPFSFSPGSANGVTDYDAARLTVDYVRRGERQVFAASAVATLGLSGTGSDQPGVIRPDPHFKVILVQTNYARRLTGGLEFKARLDAQQSSGPLYAPEQFSAGGADTVRGYRENLLLADSGVRGSLELDCPLAWNHPVCGVQADGWKSVTLEVFSDGAYMRNHLGTQPKPLGIASLGVGLAWQPTPGVLTQFSYGALRAHAPQEGPQDIQDLGIQFSVTVHPLSLFGTGL